MDRRNFLRTSLTAAGAAMLAAPALRSIEAADVKPQDASSIPLHKRLPRWRGFNLLEKFNASSNKPFVESDFQWMSQWGFDFVRVPMDYRCWTDAKQPRQLNEKVLAEIDQAVEFGKKHGIHVSLNLHRAPGYTVAKPPETLNLWKSDEAQELFDFQWSQFAKRYRGIPSTRVSFNLVNEPAKIPSADYAKVVRRVTAAIRAVDADRLVIADGLAWGTQPVPELADLDIAQATRGYYPMQISHYQAPWVHGERFAKPTWPLTDGGKTIDRDVMRQKQIEPWKELAAKGVGVMVGEWGAFNKTPHDVVLRWAADDLALWKDAGWGWVLWNFRGSFGIFDSQRVDVAYEDFQGHKLDRKFLDLLRQN